MCRTHHRLKTLGLVRVRVVDPAEDPTAAPGTLEWTTRTGLTYRRAPTPATPAAATSSSGDRAEPAGSDDPEIAAAVAHARAVDARRASRETPLTPQSHDADHADRTWRTALRTHHTARSEAARRDPDTDCRIEDPPPF